MVVLAVPVGAAPGLLREIAPRLRAELVTDVGSTKRSIVEAAAAAGIADRFLGSHPLAGDHRRGWGASQPGLFQGALVFLCPTPGTRPEVVESAERLWTSLGADPVVCDAAEHDARMAWLSHLPQAAASALALAISGSGLDASRLGPGGRDATRLAGSPPALWVDILLDNADHVEPALAALEGSVASLRAAVRRKDAAGLERLLAGANAWKEGGGWPRGTGEPHHD